MVDKAYKISYFMELEKKEHTNEESCEIIKQRIVIEEDEQDI